MKKRFKTVTKTVEISEEFAVELEKKTYLYRGRKEIITTILRDKKEAYNTDLLAYYQEMYDEAYLDYRRMVAYVESTILSEFAGRRFRWRLELSTNMLVVYVDEPDVDNEAVVEKGGCELCQ